MSRFLAPFALVALLFFTGTLAQAQIKPQMQGDVTYISGGVGDDWAQYMEGLRAQYNLHLLFAQQGTGAYFADVPVQITNARGQRVLDVTSQGPFLYARLQPGRYTVTAAYMGQAQTRAVEVPAAGGANLNFYWAGGTNY